MPCSPLLRLGPLCQVVVRLRTSLVDKLEDRAKNLSVGFRRLRESRSRALVPCPPLIPKSGFRSVPLRASPSKVRPRRRRESWLRERGRVSPEVLESAERAGPRPPRVQDRSGEAAMVRPPRVSVLNRTRPKVEMMSRDLAPPNATLSAKSGHRTTGHRLFLQAVPMSRCHAPSPYGLTFVCASDRS